MLNINFPHIICQIDHNQMTVIKNIYNIEYMAIILMQIILELNFL